MEATLDACLEVKVPRLPSVYAVRQAEKKAIVEYFDLEASNGNNSAGKKMEMAQVNNIELLLTRVAQGAVDDGWTGTNPLITDDPVLFNGFRYLIFAIAIDKHSDKLTHVGMQLGQSSACMHTTCMFEGDDGVYANLDYVLRDGGLEGTVEAIESVKVTVDGRDIVIPVHFVTRGDWVAQMALTGQVSLRHASSKCPCCEATGNSLLTGFYQAFEKYRAAEFNKLPKDAKEISKLRVDSRTVKKAREQAAPPAGHISKKVAEEWHKKHFGQGFKQSPLFPSIPFHHRFIRRSRHACLFLALALSRTHPLTSPLL
jgi:hypothetical protein